MIEGKKKKFDGSFVLALSAAACLASVAASVPVFVKIKSRNDGEIARDTQRAADALEALADPRSKIALVYLCRELPPEGTPNWIKWVEDSGSCRWVHTAEADDFKPRARVDR